VADTAVLAGCYECLQAARATYETLAVGRNRPAILPHLFETDLLIVIREKELGIDWTASLDRARQVGTELPPDVAATHYLAIVDAVIPDDDGMSREGMQAFVSARDAAGVRAHVDEDLAWLTTGTLREPVRESLAVALACSYPGRSNPPSRSPDPVPWPTLTRRPSGALEDPADAPPLVRYGVATCLGANQPVLEALLAADPRLAEIAFVLGRRATTTAETDGGARALPLATDARAHFPAAAAVTEINATLREVIGQCEDALRFYDETVALVPRHENAWLGRVECLTTLTKRAEAIDTATRMIDLKLDNAGDAYYWRAWNRQTQDDLVAARDDIGHAKALKGSDANVSTLAGVIEYRQKDFAPAEADLLNAAHSPGGFANCTALFYLAAVYTSVEKWPDGAKQFVAAMDCYSNAATVAEARARVLRARTDIDPLYAAKQIAARESDAASARTQRYAAAYNGAGDYARAGDLDRARALIAVAAEDPALANDVKTFKDALDSALK